jgi:hypothetical protein
MATGLDLTFPLFAGEADEPGFTYSGMAEYATTLAVLATSAASVFWLIAVRPLQWSAPDIPPDRSAK